MVIRERSIVNSRTGAVMVRRPVNELLHFSAYVTGDQWTVAYGTPRTAKPTILPGCVVQQVVRWKRKLSPKFCKFLFPRR